ncbi:Ubiquinol cytochrome-c reductase complex subunit 10 [Komagataella phaffii CBS 7435]|uniref:Uncharacterized protein n=2 Tax=Komagataella phaffii TaxID=460519 RepID=C4R1J2_KOMPG|nr:Hypothetical protein PAS_chr2-1_0717 [Komagataella phaffii GS115]CAH2448103.1 Ubiquinol cytochrome-c reductase complex subunit 10 [Komagataella phaffii CBS 7435]CAY69366.1 Hypothetical protein PAS_chr2-1_0717 [Komagataella phaffii GS115]CCA38248.1 Ubiquinol cytochrome-c reductase complex subunit 10 [Komagataella phaffii CBS 7435]
MVNYVKGPKYTTVKKIAGLTPTQIKTTFPILAFWGGAGLFAVFTFTENWPLFQKTFFEKIPIFGQHWIKDIDPEDVPV